MQLFRDEVFETRKQRLYGEVVLSEPLSTKIDPMIEHAVMKSLAELSIAIQICSHQPSARSHSYGQSAYEWG